MTRCQRAPAAKWASTIRSTSATVPALAATARLRRLSTRRCCTESPFIEDIPSSTHPKEIHHERHEPKPLPLRDLPGRCLHLRLPEARGTTGLRLRSAVQLRYRLRLHQGLIQEASGTSGRSRFRRPLNRPAHGASRLGRHQVPRRPCRGHRSRLTQPGDLTPSLKTAHHEHWNP